MIIWFDQNIRLYKVQNICMRYEIGPSPISEMGPGTVSKMGPDPINDIGPGPKLEIGLGPIKNIGPGSKSEIGPGHIFYLGPGLISMIETGFTFESGPGFHRMFIWKVSDGYHLCFGIYEIIIYLSKWYRGN